MISFTVTAKLICGIVFTYANCWFSHAKAHFFFFINSVLHPFQDYFSSYEMGQSVGGRKREGEPREKPPGTPASRTWLVSHVASAGLKPTPDTAVKQRLIYGHNNTVHV